jgi:uncharacterized membrane protein YfcA
MEFLEFLHNASHTGELFSEERFPWLLRGIIVCVAWFVALSLVRLATPKESPPASNPSAVLLIAIASLILVFCFPWAVVAIVGVGGLPVEAIPLDAKIWLLAFASLIANSFILCWAGGRVVQTVSKFSKLHSLAMSLLVCMFDIIYLSIRRVHGDLIWVLLTINFAGMVFGAFIGADLAMHKIQRKLK